jgi:hypothetical protein
MHTINDNLEVKGSVSAREGFILPSVREADLPQPKRDGQLVFCPDGNNGYPCLAVSAGGSWAKAELTLTPAFFTAQADADEAPTDGGDEPTEEATDTDPAPEAKDEEVPEDNA